MRRKKSLTLIVVAWPPCGSRLLPSRCQTQDKPVVPKPGLPEIMMLEGKFVRAAYNNEGYVILGYQLANRSISEEWMLLEVGMTVLDRTPAYRLKREALSLETPDGKTLPLPSISEHRAANTMALQNRERVQRDSINYFPPMASRACAMTFFPDLTARVMPVDEVELSNTRACLGRLYFHVPGGIAYGQHWLNVKFEKSLVRVPFRILTKDEEKFVEKNYGDIRKQVQDAFKQKSNREVAVRQTRLASGLRSVRHHSAVRRTPRTESADQSPVEGRCSLRAGLSRRCAVHAVQAGLGPRRRDRW